MTLQEYKQHLKEEWQFHKRHPEMILVWVVYLVSFVWVVCQ